MGSLPLIVGLVAGMCSTFAFVPQVLKIWREGDAHAISFRMYLLRVIGFALWLVYGFVLANVPLVIFNVLSILLGGAVLVLKMNEKQLRPHALDRAMDRNDPSDLLVAGKGEAP